MSTSVSPAPPQELRVFTKQTLVKGNPAEITCIEIWGQIYTVTNGPITMIRLEDEWFEDVADPIAPIETLKKSAKVRADIFSFWQRLPDVEPQHPFHIEWEDIAALPIKSYSHWWNRQIKSSIRCEIRKAEKEGVIVRRAAYDDDFVRGMTAIFNEVPVRQGRKFWHYGKDFQTVKGQFSRYIDREDIIGAYYGNELIGFMMMGDAGRYGVTTQFISTIRHRHRKTSSALIAKAVQLCEAKRLPYLVYGFWSDDQLGQFKRLRGFRKTSIPRYFVPLTRKGELALRFGLHHGWKGLAPKPIKASLKALRSRWYGLKWR